MIYKDRFFNTIELIEKMFLEDQIYQIEKVKKILL